MAFDTEVPYRAYSEYWDPNVSDEVTDRAWDAINTNPMAVFFAQCVREKHRSATLHALSLGY